MRFYFSLSVSGAFLVFFAAAAYLSFDFTSSEAFDCWFEGFKEFIEGGDPF